MLNRLFQFGVFLLQTVAFQTRQALKAHVQYRLRLLFGQAEGRHQSLAGDGRRGAGADEADHLVDAVERDEQAFQNVGARLGLVEVVACAAANDVLLMLQIVPEHALERQNLRLAVHQRQHVHAEGILHLGMLVKVVQHHVGVHVAL